MVGRRRWKAGNLFEEANEKLDFARSLSLGWRTQFSLSIVSVKRFRRDYYVRWQIKVICVIDDTRLALHFSSTLDSRDNYFSSQLRQSIFYQFQCGCDAVETWKGDILSLQKMLSLSSLNSTP